MNIRGNRRKVDGDDELAKLYADLRAAINGAIGQACKSRRPTRNITYPTVYRVVSRADDAWQR